MKEHEKLVGLPHEELRKMAPEATHQHRKGGLYRDLGIPVDSETKESYSDSRGVLRAWQHIHPHPVQVILRPASEDDKFTKIR